MCKVRHGKLKKKNLGNVFFAPQTIHIFKNLIQNCILNKSPRPSCATESFLLRAYYEGPAPPPSNFLKSFLVTNKMIGNDQN